MRRAEYAWSRDCREEPLVELGELAVPDDTTQESERDCVAIQIGLGYNTTQES